MKMTFTVRFLSAVLVLVALSGQPARMAADADADGLPDDWETQYGLDPTVSPGDQGDCRRSG